MRTFGMYNMVLGMVFGGELPQCAHQLGFALTDGSSHPALDPGLVHESSEEATIMNWTVDEASGLATAVVETLFEQVRGQPLQLVWR